MLTDTAPDVAERMYDAYRRMPPARKWKNLAQDYRFARSLHAAGVRQRRPGATIADIQRDWLASLPGASDCVLIPEPLMEPVDQEFQPILRYAIATLDRLKIAYAIGGSIASAMHGVGRMTRDSDLTVEPFPTRLAEFVAGFPTDEFYLNPDSVRTAVAERSTFNILHPGSGYKIDIFVRKDEPFEREAFARRVPFPMPPGEPVMLHTAEDIVLFKLRWYRLGGEVSERQWTDVLGVLRTQREAIDGAYLDQWAAEIGVTDLLLRVRSET